MKLVLVVGRELKSRFYDLWLSNLSVVPTMKGTWWLLNCAQCLNLSTDLSLIAGDMVTAAGGNYSTLAATGGVVAIHIQWKCNLDFDFLQNCLPE